MIAIYILIGIAAFCFMEFVAWSNHKYLMYCRICKWNKDHHRRDGKQAKMPLNTKSKQFEKNDRFFIMYATPALILMIAGFAFQYPSLVIIRIGITFYGMTCFLIHGVIIHQRLALSFLTENENRYIKAIRTVHLAHHCPKAKTNFHNYRLLIFPSRFFKDKNIQYPIN